VLHFIAIVADLIVSARYGEAQSARETHLCKQMMALKEVKQRTIKRGLLTVRRVAIRNSC
jgi:hypothetical protein